MLGKLLKYEMKAGVRLFPIIYLGICLILGTAFIAKWLNIPQLQFTMSIILVLCGVGALVITLIQVIQRFYKGLFGAEGYLKQTLPVSKGNLIASKVISSYIWMLCSIIFFVVAIAGVIYLYGGFATNIDLLYQIFGGKMTPVFIFAGISFFLQLLVFIGEIYFAITLAHTHMFIKNSVLFSVVFYFAANIVENVLELLATLFVPLGIQISDGGVSWTTQNMVGTFFESMQLQTGETLTNFNLGIGSLFTDLLLGIGLLLLARWLMTHKTSVK